MPKKMSRIKYEFFGEDAEISALSESGDGRLTLCFPEGTDGYISIDDTVVKITNSTALVDLKYVDDGEFRPILVAERCRISLPPLKKAGKTVSACAPDSDYIRSLSLRERRLEKRVCELADEIHRLRTSVYGSKIL